MEIPAALDFARTTPWSVLTTTKRDGRPQLSNVVHVVGADGLIRVSITTGRAKYHNLRRDPWAALHATREDFSAYVVVEADVELSAPAASPDDATVEELVDYYRSSAGEHDDWAEYRATMVAEARVVARLSPTHAYGMLPAGG